MMQRPDEYAGVTYYDFALIGNPVAHSLSPIMHNTVYRDLAEHDSRFQNWRYAAHMCEDEASAVKQINKVRFGHYRGMNVTMPYKRLAMKKADFVDSSADAAGGANVLVRQGFDLYAYNTDGLGALGAIERIAGFSVKGRHVAVCGTGPTSIAIACAFANAQASDVTVFSRDADKAQSAVGRMRLSLNVGATFWLRAAGYDEAPDIVPNMDVFVDATPRGMNEGDAPIVDPRLFHAGQVVFDTVYAHGESELVAGARVRGAIASDGLEMLVEQAALSIEIWARAMGIDVTVPRAVMRDAAEADG